MENAQDVPVLIVGGSLVGLSTAMWLAWHGVPSLTVERHSSTAIHPRAGHFQLRTIEILREVGLEPEVRQRSRETYDPNGGIIAVESLAGRELARFIDNLNEGVERYSPTVRVFIDQDVLEPILRRRAQELGATFQYRTELLELEQDQESVRAVVRDLESGEERTITARYVVAADGSRSPVRERLGIDLYGYGVFSHSATLYFEADCASLLQGRNSGVFYVKNPSLRGFFRLNLAGQKGFLAVNTVGEDVTCDDAVNVSEGLTEERAVALLRAAIGVPDMSITLRQIVPWKAQADVASRYHDRRIFLAGDAAHVMPPNGGFGGNTGVQDAHNLAWKLAMVLKGRADPRLLESYHAERQPIGEFTVDQSYARYATRVVPERGTDDVKELVDDWSIEIGYRYRSKAIVGDGTADDRLYEHPDTSRGRPGSRAPHVVLGGGHGRGSTLDLFGKGFVLLTGPDGAAWRASAERASRALDVPIDVAPIGAPGGLEDVDGRFIEAYGLSPAGAALVRPDGFVAWRAAESAEASRQDVGEVLASILGRGE